jgi:hypothetical protein
MSRHPDGRRHFIAAPCGRWLQYRLTPVERNGLMQVDVQGST